MLMLATRLVTNDYPLSNLPGPGFYVITRTKVADREEYTVGSLFAWHPSIGLIYSNGGYDLSSAPLNSNRHRVYARPLVKGDTFTCR